MDCQPWCDTWDRHDACGVYTGDAGEVSVGLLQLPAWPAPAVHISHGEHVHVFVPLPDAAPMHALMASLGHLDIADLIATAVQQADRRPKS
jgi:hypothetical protein